MAIAIYKYGHAHELFSILAHHVIEWVIPIINYVILRLDRGIQIFLSVEFAYSYRC